MTIFTKSGSAISYALALIMSFGTTSVKAAEETKALTLEKAMSDPDWLGRSPERPFWSADGKTILYWKKKEGSRLRDLYRQHDGDAGQGLMVPLDDWHNMDQRNAVYNQDRTLAAWVFEGDVFLQDLANGTVRQITATSARESEPTFLNDNRLSYRQADRFISYNPKDHSIRELARLEFKDQPEPVKEPKDYIAKEQHKLLSYVAKTHERAKERQARKEDLRSVNKAVVADAFYLGKGQELYAAAMSPNGDYLLVATQEKRKREKGDIMPRYVTQDGRIEPQRVRPRVADAKPRSQKITLLNLKTGEKQDLSYETLPGFDEDVLADVKRENAKAKGEKYESKKKARAINLMVDWSSDHAMLQWHKDGNVAAVMLEAWDNKDRWIATVDVQDDQKSLVSQHRLHDDAWINYNFNEFGWVTAADKPTLWYLSEESGYSHLYTKSVDAKKAKALTKGKFEVSTPVYDQANDRFVVKANQKHPGEYEIYSVPAKGGKLTALTNLGGMTDFTLSPKGDKLLLSHSKLTIPTELYVKTADESTDVTRLTDTVSREFLSYGVAEPEIIAVPSSNTKQPIYARLYKPKDWKDGEKGKIRRAVIFNHGAGYLQNSHKGWSGYFREFLFHNMLAQEGTVVLDMDYRASKGYGRDWRTAIYRQMGKPETEDLKDGVEYLVKNLNVDRSKVATYGGSYGGFMTFMALFTEPDLFAAGAALRPVTDWAHYNHGYTSNILNLPENDPIAYRRSSPIYFAEGLKAPLLINAPMVDNNVFFQDSVRLVQRLIELEKQDFEIAIYPIEPHGFREPSSWLDEYRRIYKLFQQTIYN